MVSRRPRSTDLSGMGRPSTAPVPKATDDPLAPEHRWGLPRAARGTWTVYTKGGWRRTGNGRLVHQAGWLRNRRGELSIAILTDGQPSHVYGVRTVRGIADRLLGAEGNGGR